MPKGILQDKKTGHPIFTGSWICGTAKFEDGTTKKFNGVQLIEIIPTVAGVIYQGETFTVNPREGCAQITKAYLHFNK